LIMLLLLLIMLLLLLLLLCRQRSLLLPSLALYVQMSSAPWASAGTHMQSSTAGHSQSCGCGCGCGCGCVSTEGVLGCMHAH
jgi:hypothetical protein